MGCAAGKKTRADEPPLELATLFRRFGDRVEALSAVQKRAIRAITSCRTPALGGHLQQCDRCGHREIRFHSCRNRHCPKCQGLDEVRWVEARQAELLPVEYFHVVFTIPSALHPIFLANPKVSYGLLFNAVSETLLEVAANPRNLGAKIGITSILHTWTQKLLYHPHVHCIVPGGGLSLDGTRWISARRGFLLSVRILSRVFRGKLLSKLEAGLKKGTLQASGNPHEILREASWKEWVVYAKPPFLGPEQVMKYLGRYTHRIAISNHRLVALEGDRITFRWRDRADQNRWKLLELNVEQFLRRFLLHVLPKGLMRIRHFGLLANPSRRKGIRLCQELLSLEGNVATTSNAPVVRKGWEALLLEVTGKDVTICPRCEVGKLKLREVLPPRRPGLAIVGRATAS